MKLKEGFLLRNMLGMGVVVSIDAATPVEGVITLNDTGIFLWKTMEQGETTPETLIRALTAEYDVDEQTAARDVEAFVAKAREAGLLAE